MDYGAIIPDSWASRFLDAMGTVMLVLMKIAHGEFREHLKSVRKLQGEHEIFKEKMANVIEDVSEIKADVKETRNDIKQLLRRH